MAVGKGKPWDDSSKTIRMTQVPNTACIIFLKIRIPNGITHRLILFKVRVLSTRYRNVAFKFSFFFAFWRIEEFFLCKMRMVQNTKPNYTKNFHIRFKTISHLGGVAWVWENDFLGNFLSSRISMHFKLL